MRAFVRLREMLVSNKELRSLHAPPIVNRLAHRPRPRVLSVELMYDALLAIAVPDLVLTAVPDAIQY